MRLIHCTQKILKEFDAEVTDVTPSNYDEGLGNWYANLIRIDRRKCVIFTSERTLYSFLVAGVLKKDLKNLGSLFIANLCNNLLYEGFDLRVINSVHQEYREIEVAKTRSKRVLGSMNEFVMHLKHKIRFDEGLENVDIPKLNQDINKIPMKVLEFRYPIEALEKALGNPPRKTAIPETLDEWLIEIAKAYSEAMDTKPFGIFIDMDTRDEDLYHMAAHICLKHRGIKNTEENIRKASDATLASYIAAKENVPSLNASHVAFAFCYLASHFGLGLQSQHAIERIMEYVEQEADRLMRIIEYKRR